VKIQCPICKRQVDTSTEGVVRPFCSARCKQIDLANWLDERYRIPEEIGHAEELGADPSPNLR